MVNLARAHTGLLVDTVSEVISLSKAAIQPTPPIIGARQAEQLRGVANLDEGKQLIMLLDTAKVCWDAPRSRPPSRSPEAEGEGKYSTLSAANRQSGDEEQFVSFSIANEEFGVDIQQVQEIIWMTEETPVSRKHRITWKD